jgi:ribonuclease E
MKKSLVISEHDSIAAVIENDKVVEFFVNRGELLLGDIYSATVENILPGIDAAFVNLGKDKMGFLHANDVPGQGPLKERLVPKQKLLVQITKEPTGHKGPRVSTAISLPGRFLVLVPEERGVSISRRISEARERARLKSVVNLMKPPGIGLIIRTEAKGQGENELFEDFEALWDRWQTVVSEGEASIGPTLIYRDQDLLFRVIRDAYSHEVSDIICDTVDGQHRAQEYLQGWASKQTKVSFHTGEESILVAKGIDKEIEAALGDRVELPSGGHLNIQPTEALTVIDVNSGRFTSSRTQAETVRRTNLEASQEIARQLRLRNIGGMVIVDFIDMDSRRDQQQVLEVFQRVLEEDRAKPQCGQLSDLGLVELTRRRQGQSLRELFTVHCTHCSAMGVVPTLELGHADNKRVISFKTRDEEAARRSGNRRGGVRQSGSVLRAASASNGRITPTVEAEPEEDALAFVPEDILEQMPDDLLHGKVDSAPFKKYSDNDDEDDDQEDSTEAVATAYPSKRENFAPGKSFFTDSHDLGDDEDSELESSLSKSISEVAEVFQDMGNRNSVNASHLESRVHQAETFEAEIEDVDVLSYHPANKAEAPVEAHKHGEHENGHDHENSHEHEHNHEHEHAHDHSYAHESDDEDDEEAAVQEPTPPAPEVESPYETELDPVTGIYRLKIKAPTQAISSEFQQSSDHTAEQLIENVVAEFAGGAHVEKSEEQEEWQNKQLTIPVYGTAENQKHVQVHGHPQGHDHQPDQEHRLDHEHGHEHNEQHLDASNTHERGHEHEGSTADRTEDSEDHEQSVEHSSSGGNWNNS